MPVSVSEPMSSPHDVARVFSHPDPLSRLLIVSGVSRVLATCEQFAGPTSDVRQSNSRAELSNFSMVKGVV
jgi:hypothetical protein